ncbi:hypothetical protein ES705_26376 [subsurface metagenome]
MTVIGMERFKIDRSLGHFFSLKSRDKRDALKERRFFEIENIAHRGEYVDMADIVLNYYQGNPDRRVVG